MPNNEASGQLRQSLFYIPKMDCPSEEKLVRMALADLGDMRLSFDLPRRELIAVHRQPPTDVLERIAALKLGAVLRESALLPSAGPALRRSVFSIAHMDCPAEEKLIRLALQDLPGISSLSFDLAQRRLTALHAGPSDAIMKKLAALNLGAALQESAPLPAHEAALPDAAADGQEARTLWWLLAMNAAMFVIELAVGLYAESTGLIADSLDMFADAAVYGMALYAVGRAARVKVRVAHFAGWVQLLLGLMALAEVGRGIIFGSEPRSSLMMSVSALALAVNVTSLILIGREKRDGAHMKASYIFSANDVIANLGVIVAGALVAWTGAPYPDLVIGTIISIIVMNGARRILQLK